MFDQSGLEKKFVLFMYGYFTYPLNSSNIIHKHNSCVLPRLIKHEFVVDFITYLTFDVELIDFCMFSLGTILYKKVVPAM